MSTDFGERFGNDTEMSSSWCRLKIDISFDLESIEFASNTQTQQAILFISGSNEKILFLNRRNEISITERNTKLENFLQDTSAFHWIESVYEFRCFSCEDTYNLVRTDEENIALKEFLKYS